VAAEVQAAALAAGIDTTADTGSSLAQQRPRRSSAGSSGRYAWVRLDVGVSRIYCGLLHLEGWMGEGAKKLRVAAFGWFGWY
jgi:hypothetical protein